VNKSATLDREIDVKQHSNKTHLLNVEGY